MRLVRTLALVVVVAAYLALGPWVLLLALLSLLVPSVRRALRPTGRQLLVFVLVLGACVAAVLVIPDGRLPIPPGGGLLVTPRFEGTQANLNPITLEVPKHPQLAANGSSSMHNDGWATDAYAGPGPLGIDPEVDSAWYGVKECATLAFDTQERMVGLCGSVTGPVLHLIDPDSMEPIDSLELPRRTGNTGKRPWEDICGGAYFYLDDTDTAFVGTTRRTIEVVATADMSVERTIDLTDVIPDDDCLIALMPDWEGAGTWWVSQDGRVGHADESGSSTVLALDEEIANSVSVDAEGLYVVTVEALYKLRVGAQEDSRSPEIIWRAPYDNGDQLKPGQLSAGSGTTPTVLPSGLVAITDNAEPQMNVQFYDGESGELVCEAPVFSAAESASDNSLVAVGEASVVVENNYGYDSPLSTTLGRATPGGFARVDAVPTSSFGGTRECQVTWTSDEIGPTSVAKVSLENGLVYAYTTKPSRWGVQAWYVTAIDAATGDPVFSVRTGTGSLFNNHYSAVTLAPDGSLYIATLGGMVRLRDG